MALKRIVAICALAFSLQGCLFLFGAAAGVAIVGSVVYDKRSPQITNEDTQITTEIQSKLNEIPDIKNKSNIVVTTFNEVVLLAGQTPSNELKNQAVSIAQSVPNIRRIYNEITINGKSSSLSNMSDSWISTKLKSRLIAEKDLESSQIQVVVVNGNVYLMGIVSHDQADIAVAVAQHVSGVQKVVKIFEYDDPA